DLKSGDIFREAQILQRLTESETESDNEGRQYIIRVHDCGFASEHDGRKINPYITMDYIPDGTTLENYVYENGPFKPEVFFPIAQAIALALNCAHRNNVLHRDVHPANVLIKPETNGQWTVRLIDFGLAAIRRIAEESRTLSAFSNIDFIDPVKGGRLGYAAPEQLEPQKYGSLGWHSDVYSFGKVVYFACFSDPDPDDFEKQGLETAWKTLLSKATAKKKKNRHRNFAEIITELDELVNKQTDQNRKTIFEVAPIESPPPSLGYSAQNAGERKVLSINQIEIPLRWCPPGTFTMGSPKGQQGRYDDEDQVQVTLTKGFWMMETEVTQGLWREVMGADQNWKEKYGLGPQYPVYNVNWNEATEFATKLNEKLQKELPDNLRFQLPTEAQWEYAARAGTTTRFVTLHPSEV
ncbi:MAG: bifunctional serine/threonine-protein kinase/formylglycine-generating enzyme family protein, partial [Isosphaeraceae bacterium]